MMLTSPLACAPPGTAAADFATYGLPLRVHEDRECYGGSADRFVVGEDDRFSWIAGTLMSPRQRPQPRRSRILTTSEGVALLALIQALDLRMLARVNKLLAPDSPRDASCASSFTYILAVDGVATPFVRGYRDIAYAPAYIEALDRLDAHLAALVLQERTAP